MSLLLSGDLRLRKTYVGTDDPDAAAYIAAVEQADGEALETATRVAIHSFVKGCKADGIWPAIKASCILAGARTLEGALVPLVGTAPTNVGPFVSGDYNRKTGLVGNGSTKYLDSNRNNNADPQNSNHNAVCVTSFNGNNFSIMGAADPFNETGANSLGRSPSSEFFTRNRTATSAIISGAAQTGLAGFSRSTAGSYTTRANGANTQITQASETPSNRNVLVYGRAVGAALSPSRLAFYSIGEALNLALLDARVTDLINAFGAAIP